MESIRQTIVSPPVVESVPDSTPDGAVEPAATENTPAENAGAKPADQSTDEHELPTEEITPKMVDRITIALRERVSKRPTVADRRAEQAVRAKNKKRHGHRKNLGRVASVMSQQRDRLPEEKPKKSGRN